VERPVEAYEIGFRFAPTAALLKHDRIFGFNLMILVAKCVQQRKDKPVFDISFTPETIDCRYGVPEITHRGLLHHANPAGGGLSLSKTARAAHTYSESWIKEQT
jgi:hypothetical protein